jgi:8-oxo-dGTP diphosphatase
MPISPYVARLRKHVGTDLLMLPSACGVVVDDRGRILCARRADNGNWTLPSGAVDPGEQPADACVREVFEETGVRVAVQRLAGVMLREYVYPHGDVCQYVTTWFRCRPIGGEAVVNDDESTAVAWFALDDVPELDDVDRIRLDTALPEVGPAWFAPPGTMKTPPTR